VNNNYFVCGAAFRVACGAGPDFTSGCSKWELKQNLATNQGVTTSCSMLQRPSNKLLMYTRVQIHWLGFFHVQELWTSLTMLIR